MRRKRKDKQKKQITGKDLAKLVAISFVLLVYLVILLKTTVLE